MDGRKGATAGAGGAEKPLEALLRVLRADLAEKVSAGEDADLVRALSLNSRAQHAIYRPEGGAAAASNASTNELLSSIAAGDAALQRSMQRQIQRSTQRARLDALRRRRRELQALRVAREAWREQQKRRIDRECGEVGAAIERQRTAFEYYVQQSDCAATQRLQMLFHECVAEMKKAVVRMDGVAADAQEEAASMVDAQERRFRWQLFLTRLEEDFRGGGVSTSALYPPRTLTPIPSYRSSGDAPAALCSALTSVMQTHGPSLPSHQSLEVRSVVAIKKGARLSAQPSPEKSKWPPPSLHFDDSAAEAWSGILNELQQFCRDQRATVKPAPSSGRSTRRIRRLPAPSQQRSVSDVAVFQTQQQGSWTHVRQLVATNTPQFTGIECDVPLSSSFIRWLAPAASQRFKQAHHDDYADCNIYFDLAEYHHKLSASLQSTEATNQLAGVSGMAVISSVRSALTDVNSILGTYRATLQANRSLRDMVAALPDVLLLGHRDKPEGGEADGRGRVFVRASVLQLVQTIYYSTQFLPEFPRQDRLALEQQYPLSITGAGFLSALYVPLVDASEPGDNGNQVGETTSLPDSSTPKMVPLSDAALHELLLVYIARSRRLDAPPVTNNSNEVNDVLVSMAQSDAAQALLPLPHKCASTSDTRVCVIKNPRGVLQPLETQKRTDGQSTSKLLQAAGDADYLFVELAITEREDSGQLTVARPLPSTRRPTAQLALELLGSTCQWRSCLDMVDDQAGPSAQLSRVCAWHSALQMFLSDDDEHQYLPNLPDIRAVLADNTLTRVESAKRAIQRSSSLLEELASRQLSHSLRAFFDHVRASLANSAFLKSQRVTSGSTMQSTASISLPECDDNAEKTIQALQDALELTQAILQTERRATLAIHCLRKLVAQSHPHAMLGPSNVLDIAELNRAIRTTDLELVLQLSRQKLQLLQQLCRAEEEARDSAEQLLKDSYARSREPFGSINVSAPVFDVVHVLRKGRRSLQMQQQQRQQQRQQRQPPVKRPQSAARRSDPDDSVLKSLQRAASDFDQQGEAGREWSNMSLTSTEQPENPRGEGKRDRRSLRRVVVQ